MACELLPLQEVVFPLVSTLRSDVSRRLYSQRLNSEYSFGRYMDVTAHL